MATQRKIALVTGGSRGLGRNMALAIAGKGIDVVITYLHNKTEADNTVKAITEQGGKAAALQLNTGDVKSFPAFLEQFSATLKNTFGADKFQFLVNNAGVGVHASVTDTTEAQFDDVMNIHVKGVFFLTQQTLPLMEDGGRIINISTGLARFATPGFAAYAAAKGAVEVYTRYLAKELGVRGIAANVVAPGAIETDFGGGVVRDNEQMNKIIASVTSLGRVGLPDDIGGVVAFLCTDEARWINAQRIEVSGGQNL